MFSSSEVYGDPDPHFIPTKELILEMSQLLGQEHVTTRLDLVKLYATYTLKNLICPSHG